MQQGVTSLKAAVQGRRLPLRLELTRNRDRRLAGGSLHRLLGPLWQRTLKGKLNLLLQLVKGR